MTHNKRSAYCAARIEIRRGSSAGQAAWFEVVAVGWDGHDALLAAFRTSLAARSCRTALLERLRHAVRKAAAEKRRQKTTP